MLPVITCLKILVIFISLLATNVVKLNMLTVVSSSLFELKVKTSMSIPNLTTLVAASD